MDISRVQLFDELHGRRLGPDRLAAIVDRHGARGRENRQRDARPEGDHGVPVRGVLTLLE